MDFFRSFGRNFFEYTQGKATYNLDDKSLSGYEVNELFRNDGSGRFTRVGYCSGAGSKRDGRGFVPGDFRRTGALDFFVVNNAQPWLYLENTAAIGRHHAIVQLKGRKSNSYGVGARIRLTAGGRSQVREINAGSGFLSSPAPEAHFGLGSADRIEKIEVRWPWTKEWQEVREVDADKVVVIEEGAGFSYRKIGRKWELIDGH
ncbi:ASPIC/UnbV domain-containing protein [bacterium]|nr:ASPIC/UnbV domain-containing protein [bacterium]